MGTETLIKKSITLSPEVHSEILARVKKGGYSAYINDVMTQHFDLERLGDMIRTWDEELGPVSDEMLAKVRADKEAADREIGIIR